VSHELPSLFAIANDGVFLDAETRRPIAHGSPSELRDNCTDPQVAAFMRRERPEVLAAQKDLVHMAAANPMIDAGR
jgi:phospholipid/cholesterol/gamma-HCH transport system ATP-binding protein